MSPCGFHRNSDASGAPFKAYSGMRAECTTILAPRGPLIEWCETGWRTSSTLRPLPSTPAGTSLGSAADAPGRGACRCERSRTPPPTQPVHNASDASMQPSIDFPNEAEQKDTYGFWGIAGPLQQHRAGCGMRRLRSPACPSGRTIVARPRGHRCAPRSSYSRCGFGGLRRPAAVRMVAARTEPTIKAVKHICVMTWRD